VEFSIRAHLPISRALGETWLKLECMLAPQKSEKLRFLPASGCQAMGNSFSPRSATTPSAPAQHFVCACPSQGLCIFYKATHFLISLAPLKSRFLLICSLYCVSSCREIRQRWPFWARTPLLSNGPMLTMKGHVNTAHCFDCGYD
jgi:hypothetical protein